MEEDFIEGIEGVLKVIKAEPEDEGASDSQELELEAITGGDRATSFPLS
jgi:hypothetical protein